MRGIRIKIVCMLFSLFVYVPGIANASLMDLGSGVLFDDVAEQYWVQDLSEFNQMTYAAQINAIGTHTITIGSTILANWRMAGASDVTSLLATIGGNYDHLSNVSYPVAFLRAGYTYSDPFSSLWFLGRIDKDGNADNTHAIWGYKQNAGYPQAYPGTSVIVDSEVSAKYGAWVVMDQPVPEPSSSALLGLGGLALMLRRRR